MLRTTPCAVAHMCTSRKVKLDPTTPMRDGVPVTHGGAAVTFPYESVRVTGEKFLLSGSVTYSDNDILTDSEVGHPYCVCVCVCVVIARTCAYAWSFRAHASPAVSILLLSR